MLGVSFFDLGGVIVRFCKFTVFCVAVLAICGCDQGQPTPPALTSAAPTSQGPATSAVTPTDFAATIKAAESGDADAQFDLGLMYNNGQGVPKDYAEAVKWFRLAADQGFAKGQNGLGLMYNIGQGVPKDYAEAVKWYRLAAEQGYVSAQFNLGLMYNNGQGVLKDYAEAVKWFRLAAEQGDVDAQHELGFKYYMGQGVPHDYAEAYVWFTVTVAGDNAKPTAAHFCDILEGKLTPGQLAEGQNRATELLEKIGSGK